MKLALLLGACCGWCPGRDDAAAKDPGVFPELLHALLLAGILEHGPLHEPSSRGPWQVLQSVQYHIRRAERRFNDDDDDGDGMATLETEAWRAAVEGNNAPRGVGAIPRLSFFPNGA